MCCVSKVFAVYPVNLGHNEWRRKQARSRGSPDEFLAESRICLSSKLLYAYQFEKCQHCCWQCLSSDTQKAAACPLTRQCCCQYLLKHLRGTGCCWWAVHTGNLLVRTRIFTSVGVKLSRERLNGSLHNKYALLVSWLALQIFLL